MEKEPAHSDAEQQDPESAPAAEAPAPNAEQTARGEGDDPPPVERLDEDPAYEPEGTGLKDIKGG